VSVETFLRQRSVRVEALGTYTLPNWYDPQGRLRTFACRTTRVSPFRMILDVPVVGKVGDRLTSYFRDFGKFDGEITDTIAGSFLVELEMTRAMRVRLADKLEWLEKKQKDTNVRDLRRDARFIPNAPHTLLTLADGTLLSCFIITSRCPASRSRPRFSRRLGSRSRSEAMSAASCASLKKASPSNSSSRQQTFWTWSGASFALRSRTPGRKLCAIVVEDGIVGGARCRLRQSCDEPEAQPDLSIRCFAYSHDSANRRDCWET
jgi:hypothetical protein